MKELNFDSGLVAYSLNGKCEVSFNPTDSNFVERLYSAFEDLDKKQESYKAQIEKMADKKEIFEFARERDAEIETNTGGIHWWTILSAYSEIGDCLFAQIVRIRDKKAKGKSLDKSDREFYRKNRDIIDIKHTYSEAENKLVSFWTGAK